MYFSIEGIHKKDEITHYEAFLTKYCKQIKSLELDDYFDESTAELLLHKERLKMCVNLTHLKVSANISTKFLQSSAFDILQITRLSSLEFGSANNFAGQITLLIMLSRTVSKTNLQSIRLGSADVSVDLYSDILAQLFQNSPMLQVFDNYTGTGHSDAWSNKPRYWVDDSHLIAMTTTTDNGPKLKDLKLKLCSNRYTEIQPNVFYEFLSSYSTSLESLSVQRHVTTYDTNTSFQSLLNRIPEFPLLTHLELSSPSNTNFLAQMPNLSKLILTHVVADNNCLNEFSRVICPNVKSLTIDAFSWDYSNMSKKYKLKDHVDYVQKLTSCFRDLESFELTIHQHDVEYEKKLLSLGVYLERDRVETLFATSPAMEDLQVCNGGFLTEADVYILKKLKNLMELFVPVITSNCSKFLALKQLNKEPVNKGIPNQDFLCVLSHGLSYEDMKLASRQSLKTNQSLGKYGFIHVVVDSELPTIAIGPRKEFRTQSPSTTMKALF